MWIIIFILLSSISVDTITKRDPTIMPCTYDIECGHGDCWVGKCYRGSCVGCHTCV